MGRGWACVLLLGSLLALAGCLDPTDFPGSAEEQMKEKVSKMVLLYDDALNDQCDSRKVVKTAAIKINADGYPDSERWTVDQCGKTVNYIVTYKPNGLIGYNYDYDIHPET
jgi:hypothetical protein